MSLVSPVAPSSGTEAASGSSISLASIVLLLTLIAYPLVVPSFFTFQIGAQALILGMISLSLMVLAGYGGMLSLAQLTIAGIAAYTVAIFGHNSVGVMGLGWPWWIAAPFAIALAAASAALIGLVAVRSVGIYMIMITLAISTAFYYFALQNYSLFNGFSGYRGVAPPTMFGIYLRDPIPFYYLALTAAAAAYGTVIYSSRSPFGLALQATRDNQRRMRALGYNVTAIKVFAWALAGVIAGTAGVLLVWFNGRISPGTVSVAETIGILVIAVIGGIKHPIGPFIGAFFYVLLKTFAIDLVNAERFNTLIGLVFLLIVLFSPDGMLGFWARLKPYLDPEEMRARR
jgi:branched-chain amino acid transport system permease protein